MTFILKAFENRQKGREIIKLIFLLVNCSVFILITLNTLKREEIRVHLWTVKMKFSTYRPLKYSTFQYYCAVIQQ